MSDGSEVDTVANRFPDLDQPGELSEIFVSDSLIM